MTVAAFVLSCISLVVALTVGVFSVKAYRRAGARVIVSMHKARRNYMGLASPPLSEMILVIKAENHGMATAELNNPHWEIKGQKDAAIPVRTAQSRKLEGYSSTEWTYDLPHTCRQLGVTSERPVTIRPAVFGPAGKTVRGKWLTLTVADLDEGTVTTP